MIRGLPFVMIASVSLHESRLLERALGSSGWELLLVDDAEEAVRQIDGGDAEGAVLVIDAGLLEMRDPQWRRFREQHSELGTVVRCLVPRSERTRWGSVRTREVHPDDIDGTCRAVRSLDEASAA